MKMIKTSRPLWVEGVHIPMGTSELPEGLDDHWYIKAMCEDGDAVVFFEGETEQDKPKKTAPKKVAVAEDGQA